MARSGGYVPGDFQFKTEEMMKFCKLFMAVIVLCLMVTCVGFCENEPTFSKQTITVNAQMNCSGDSVNGWKRGEKTFTPGVWAVEATGGGWSCWASDRYAPPDVSGPWGWLVYIKRADERTSFCYGRCGDWWQFGSLEEAAKSVQTKESLPLTFEKETDVYFWLLDANPRDNRGNIILTITRLR